MVVFHAAQMFPLFWANQRYTVESKTVLQVDLSGIAADYFGKG